MKKIILLLVLGGLFFLAGCASRQEIVRFKEQLNYLEESNKRLEKRNARLDSLVTAQHELIQKMRADFRTSLEDIEERLRISENKLDDLSYFFSQSFKKLEQIPKPPPAPDTAQKPNSPSLQIDARQIYETAQLDLTKGNYDLAILGFTEFLKNFSNSELADNAQYWLAECHYAKEDFPQAIEQYKKLIDNYHQSDKVPNGLYKLGLCHQALKARTQANKYFKELIDRYPTSQEAKLAKEKMGLKKK